MIKPINPDDPLLKKFLRRCSLGDYLFRQGDAGNTMFIILEGVVLLFHRERNLERLVGTLGSGEMVGEKAILNRGPYRHNFTAQAKSEATVLEFDAENFKVLQTKIPEFSMMMLRVLSTRLDESNEMVFILQSVDEVDRVVKYLAFFCHHHSKKVPEGMEIVLSAIDIQHAVNVDEDKIKEILAELTTQKILVKRKDGYIISDENALLDQISYLKERTAA
jgi:CRP/FNR family cyclic AMP-dependent transcriptional regulator